jgi:molybdopterin converting factor small subunit
MARTPKSKDLNSAESGFNKERLDEAENATQELVRMNQEASENAHAVAEQLGYVGDLTVVALENEIRFYQRRTIEDCLELGKRLLILKELTLHGGFSQRLELLGISDRMAQKFMAATFKFANTNSSSLLRAAGNQTKMLELVVLDDGEIEALERGESVRGVKLDDIDTMSSSELKKALRDARADAEAKDQVLAEKNQKLDELDKKLRKRKEVELVPWDERVGDLNGELSMIALGVEELLEKYWVIFEAMRAAQFENDEKERARSMLAKNFHDRTQRIVERVAHIQASMFEEFDGYINEPKHLLAGSEG